MTKYKPRSVFVVPVLLLSSVAANAATDMDAVEACSDAIATSLVSEQGDSLKVRIDQSVVDANRRLGRRTIFHMDITDPATSDVVGRFDCTVNHRAEVRTLKRLSIDASSAKERSRT